MGPQPGHTTDDLRAELADLRQRVEQNDEELDAMQIAAAKTRSRPWHREPGVLIAVLSLVLAFGTTIVSTIRLEEDRRHQARAELSDFISRLADVSKEQAEVAGAGGPNAGNIVAMLNGELLSIANQARQAIRAIPDEVATGEYVAVGYAFQNQGQFETAEDLYAQGFARATTPSDKVIALRSLGLLKFLEGDPNSARAFMQQALDVYTDDTKTSAVVVANDNATTHLYWANAELARTDCAAADEHVAAASELISRQRLSGLLPTLQQIQVTLAACRAASPGPVPSAQPT